MLHTTPDYGLQSFLFLLNFSLGASSSNSSPYSITSMAEKQAGVCPFDSLVHDGRSCYYACWRVRIRRAQSTVCYVQI